MAVCRFCDQEFSNPQAVRAHLRGCGAYKERGAGAVVSVAAPVSMPKRQARKAGGTGGFSRADQIQGEVAASEARLRLRHVEAAHRDFEQEEQRARDRELATQRVRRDEEQAARARVEREKVEATVRTGRRAIIQGIKAEVMRRSVPYHVSSALQAGAVQAIEKDLSGLPVDELPRAELLQIAEAARDRAYQPAIEEQRKSQERDKRRSQESLERMGKMRKAREYVQSYLDREVRCSGLEDEVDYFERRKIADRIKDSLEMEFEDDSNPSAAVLRETVEDLVSEELAAWTGDDDDEDDDDQDEDRDYF